MSRERICGRSAGNYLPVRDVAEIAGVHPRAVHEWIRNHGYRKCPHFQIRRGTAYVLTSVADEYLAGGGAPRVPERPKGWVPLEIAIEQSGFNRTWWWSRIRRGEIRAVRWRRAVLVHPRDVEAELEEAKRILPPPGWVLLSELSQKAGITLTTLKQRAMRMGIRWRIYAHPRTHSDAAYVRESDARRLLEAGLPPPPPGWVPYSRLVRGLVSSPSVVSDWLRKRGYPVVRALHPDGNAAGYCPPEAWEAWLEMRRRTGKQAIGLAEVA